MAKEVLVVFTWRPVDLIKEERGSKAWTLNPTNARKCRYIVCTRNRYHEDAPSDFEHRAAFLVGKISGVELCEPGEANESPRYLVRISEYALPKPLPDVWPKHHMPIWYVDNLAAIGIDVGQLEWIEMPPEPNRSEITLRTGSEPVDTPPALTIAEAKLAVSKKFGVSPEQIEITIRA